MSGFKLLVCGRHRLNYRGVRVIRSRTTSRVFMVHQGLGRRAWGVYLYFCCGQVEEAYCVLNGTFSLYDPRKTKMHVPSLVVQRFGNLRACRCCSACGA